MTVLIHTVGGFTYAANYADIPKLKAPKGRDIYTDKPEYWSPDEILLYWDILQITKGLVYLPGNKEGIGVWNTSIRVKDIVSIEKTYAVEVIV